MAYNLDLMRAVREQITKHPETHEQASWGLRRDCGTTHCIAGWACALNEPEGALVWEFPDYTRTFENLTGVLQGSSFVCVNARAEELLGLDWLEAGDLFYAGNQEALLRLDELIQKGESAA